MLLLTGSRSRGVIACAALTITVAFMLALASHASAAYLVPNFSVTAAPTQAAGHPKITVSIDPDAAKADTAPVDDLKDITIDAPAGLQLNQAAVASKCSETTFTGGTCPTGSQVGTASVKWRRSSISSVTLTGGVFVLATPTTANSAALGLVLKATGYKTQRVRAVVSNAVPVNAPTRVTVTGLLRNVENSLGLALSSAIDQIDVVLNAKANAGQTGPYFTLNPSACTAAVTQATFTSYAGVVVPKSSSFTPTGCGSVLYDPVSTVTPTSSTVGSATGVNAGFTIATADATTQRSVTKSIQIQPTTGTSLNQAGINAVAALCSDTQLSSDSCPAGSKVGATSFTFPASLPAWSGDIYLLARTGPQIRLGGIARGTNGSKAIILGTATDVDLDGDTALDNVRVLWDQLPNAPWSSATLNISAPLLKNGCNTGNSITTMQSASAATLVRNAQWSTGDCPLVETTITSGPNGLTSIASPQFAFISSIPGATFQCQMDGAAFASCSTPYTSQPVTDGPHTFCVRASSNGIPDPSPACRSFTVDTIPPTVTIVSPGPSVTFVTEPGATVTCRLNNSSPVSCTSPWTISLPSTGYSITICATDPAGNTGCSTLVVDPPLMTVTITIAPPSVTSSSSATFGFVASTSPATFECSFDGGPYSACVSPKTYTAYTMGSHTFCVRGRDTNGNLSSNIECRSFTYENPPPPMQLIRTAPAASPSNSTTASFTVTNVPAGSTLMGSLDGGAASAFTSPKVFTGLADGAHVFTVYAVDGTGAASPAVSDTWVVDTIAPPAPTLVRVSPVTSPSSSTSAQFTFTDTESPVTFQASLDGGAYAVATSPVSITALSNGTHTFSVRAVDAAGNISVSASNSWMAGGPPPQAPLVTGPTGYVASTSATITFSTPQSGMTAECQLDGAPWTTCTSPRMYTGLTQGSHVFCVRMRDVEGNTSSSTCISWTVDTVGPPAPTLTRVSPTSSPTTSTTAQFVFSDTEAGVTFQGSLDGAAYVNVTSPVNLTGLAGGTHTYSVRAVDFAGNAGASTSNTWTIQSGPIVPSITSGPASPTPSSAASFVFTGAPVGATYECQLDGGAWTACVSPTNFSGLSEGTHTFCVRIVDSGGNISTSACRTWTIDITPPAAPTVTLVSPGASPTNQTTATISWVGAEPGGSFQRSVDGGSFTTALSPLNLSGLSDGCHTVSVRQVDIAGNTGSASAVSWCVGGVPPLPAPTLTRMSPSSSPASQSTATFVVSGQPAGTTILASLDGAPFAATTSPINLTGLADGTHTFTVRLIDAAGTTSPDVSNSWSIDTVVPAAPPVALTSPVSSPTTQTSATVVIGLTESGLTLQGSLDGAAFATVSGTVSLTGLSLGTHTYSARQVDSAGNTSSVSTIVWTIIAPTTDTLPPSINGLSSSLGAGGATITYSASDNSGATPTCTPASGTTFPFHSTATLIVEVACLDGSGNMNWTSLNVSSNGPAAGLVTTLSGGPNGNTTDPAPTFSYTVNRSTSGTLPCSLGQTCAAVTVPLLEFNCTLDGSVVDCGVGSFTSPALPLGVHTFCVGSRGIYSGEASAPACRTFTVINPASTPPDVTVTSPPFYGGTGASPINVAYRVNGGTSIPAGTTCSVNGVPSTTPTTNAAVLELGSNAIPVTCTNASGSDTEFVVMTRYSGYAVAITTPAPGSSTSSPSVNVTYNTRSYGASGSCSINGVASGSGSSNNVALPMGTSSIDLVCPWGNSVTKSSISVTRGVAPAVAITAPADNSSAPGSTNVSYTVDGSASIPAGTTCRVNGAASTSATSNTVALIGTANLVTVSCSNPYGYNTATITVNNTVPDSVPTITSGPTGVVNSINATFTFTGTLPGGEFQCRLDAGGWVGCSSPRTLTGLSQGSHTFCVRWVDTLGNAGTPACRTWSIDTVPPPAPVVSGPPSPTAQSTVSISFSNSEAGVTFEGSLDGAAFAPVTSPVTLTSLSSGTHAYSVRSKDAAGNVGSATTVTWTYESPQLLAAITSGPSGTVASTSATFEYSANLAVGTTYLCRLDGTAFASCASPTNYVSLSQGAHTFCVRAINGALTSADMCRSWTVDTEGPVVAIVSPLPSQQPAGSTSVNFTTADPSGVGSVTCALDAASSASCSSPWQLPYLSSGSHQVTICATDMLGNPSCNTYTWTTPDASLSVSITSGPSGTITNPAVAFSYQTSEPVYLPNPCYPANVICVQVIVPKLDLQCNLDGGAPMTCPLGSMYGGSYGTTVDPGPHTFCVQATRISDNATAVACRSFTYAPPPPPEIVITSPSDGSFTQAATTEVSYTVTTSSGEAASCDQPSPFTASLNEGPNTIVVNCMDSTNQATTASISVTRDSTPPTVTITSPSGPTAAYPLVGNFAIVDNTPITSTTCALDNGAAVACASPYSLPAASSGVHTFSVCATDSASNSTCATSNFDYESPMPLVNITSGPSGTVASTSATFAFISNITPAMFYCNLDSSAYSSCSSPKSFSALTPGAHTFCVRAMSTVGDVGPSACRTWTVAAGNVVAITSGPAEGSIVTTSTATFTYAAVQQLTGTPCPVGQTCVQVIVDITPYYCSFDGGGYQFCGVTTPTSPRFTTPALANGAHTFCVRASGVSGIDPQTHNAIPNGVYGPSTCRSFTKTT